MKYLVFGLIGLSLSVLSNSEVKAGGLLLEAVGVSMREGAKRLVLRNFYNGAPAPTEALSLAFTKPGSFSFNPLHYCEERSDKAIRKNTWMALPLKGLAIGKRTLAFSLSRGFSSTPRAIAVYKEVKDLAAKISDLRKGYGPEDPRSKNYTHAELQYLRKYCGSENISQLLDVFYNERRQFLPTFLEQMEGLISLLESKDESRPILLLCLIKLTRPIEDKKASVTFETLSSILSYLESKKDSILLDVGRFTPPDDTYKRLTEKVLKDARENHPKAYEDFCAQRKKTVFSTNS